MPPWVGFGALKAALGRPARRLSAAAVDGGGRRPATPGPVAVTGRWGGRGDDAHQDRRGGSDDSRRRGSWGQGANDREPGAAEPSRDRDSRDARPWTPGGPRGVRDGPARDRPPPRDPNVRPWEQAAPVTEAPWVDDGPPQKLYVTCAPGLEDIVGEELRCAAIGATDVSPGRAGVSCTGTLAVAYRANLWLRCGVRVLVLLASGPLWPRNGRPPRPAAEAVYDFGRRAVDWPALLAGSADKRRPPLTFSFNCRVWSCGDLTSDHLAAVRLKDAVCDALKDARGVQPERPLTADTADVPLFASFYQGEVLIYRDTSGASLHKRGYRDAMHKASLNEAIAAGMLYRAGWPAAVADAARHQGQASAASGAGLAPATPMLPLPGDAPSPVVLCDPLCGSGTLLIEAGLMAARRAPGLLRPRWPFERWADHDARGWQAALDDARAAGGRPPRAVRLLGNDRHPGACALARKDAAAAGVTLELTNGDVSDYVPSVAPGLVTTNPPWGARLQPSDGALPPGDAGATVVERVPNVGTMGPFGGSDGWDLEPSPDGDELAATWTRLGLFLKAHCRRSNVWVLSGSDDVTRDLCLRAERRWPIKVGGIDCRLLHYKVLGAKPGGTAKSESQAQSAA